MRLWCVCILGLTPDILPAGPREPFHGVTPNSMLCVGQCGGSEGTRDIFSGGRKQEAICSHPACRLGEVGAGLGKQKMGKNSPVMGKFVN